MAVFSKSTVAALVAFTASLPIAHADISLVAYSDADCGSAADVVASFSGTNLCRATPGARSLQQVATMSGCAINIFSDASCTPADFVDLVNLGEGCHTGESFNSVKIQCIADGR